MISSPVAPSSFLSALSGGFLGNRVAAAAPASEAHIPSAAPVAVRAEAAQGPVTQAVSRRQALLLTSAAAALPLTPHLPPPALALGAPKGFSAKEDSIDRYRFFYPFGWQEVVVKGQDVVFKDVIEPLESVAVNVIQTEKSDVAELGPPDKVAQALVEKVLTGPTQKSKVIAATEKVADGRKYYVFEFVASAPNYTRHALGVVTVANGNFYTLTTGSKERRWSTVEETLRAIVNSFEAI